VSGTAGPQSALAASSASAISGHDILSFRFATAANSNDDKNKQRKEQEQIPLYLPF
jgi:hypothetical protein